MKVGYIVLVDLRYVAPYDAGAYDLLEVLARRLMLAVLNERAISPRLYSFTCRSNMLQPSCTLEPGCRLLIDAEFSATTLIGCRSYDSTRL
jgi:hypothetical protein